MKTFTLYHIKGHKWGCTVRPLHERIREYRKEGYTMDDVCETETYTDLHEASEREYELNIQCGYRNQQRKYADYYERFKNQHKSSPRTKKGAKHSQETIEKMKGPRPHLRGIKKKPHTEETKQKLREVHLGQKRDEDWKKNIRSSVRESTSKVTAEDVKQIRQMYESGMKQSEIAKHYDIGKMTISRIVRRVTWFDV